MCVCSTDLHGRRRQVCPVPAVLAAFQGTGAEAELMRSACAGHVASRIVQPCPLAWYIDVRGHRLWRSGPWIWCARCGCHSSQRAVGLKGHCTPKNERQSRELGNLRAGRGPRDAAARSRMYQPERLTVAAWVTFTGQQAPQAGAGPRELMPEELHEQREEERWQVGPTAGHLTV